MKSLYMYKKKGEYTMTIEKRKQSIKKHMGYLLEAKKFLIERNKDVYAQRSIKTGFIRFNSKFLIEIESKQVGGTDADWIRLQYDDVFLFLHNDGTEWYQLDPHCEYGAELIDARSEIEFFNAVDNLGDIEEHYNW